VSASTPHSAINNPPTAPPIASKTLLRKQLRNNAAGPRAQREAHADFALPHTGAREEKIRGVRADDDQDQHRKYLQRRERVNDAFTAARHAPERQQLVAQAFVRLRIGGDHPLRRGIELCLRLFARHAGLQLREHEIRARRAAGQLLRRRLQLGRHRQRKEHIESERVHSAAKSFRRHTDHRERTLIQLQRLADHVCGAPKVTLPEGRAKSRRPVLFPVASLHLAGRSGRAPVTHRGR
jgi:hypothetical protein